jgi:hypothetical protein
MRLTFGRFSGRFRQALAVAAAMAVAGTSAGPTDAATLLQRLFGGGGGASSGPPNALQINPQDFEGPGYCPELRLLVGGENFAMFERDHAGDAKYVRYLGSITDTARECTTITDTGISIKLGVAGRVVAGPKGGAGKVTLPLKVTVLKQHGNKVLFSKTYSATVTLGGADLSGTFSQVIDPVAFKRTANDEDLIIYVGFDQGKTAASPTG